MTTPNEQGSDIAAKLREYADQLEIIVKTSYTDGYAFNASNIIAGLRNVAQHMEGAKPVITEIPKEEIKDPGNNMMRKIGRSISPAQIANKRGSRMTRATAAHDPIKKMNRQLQNIPTPTGHGSPNRPPTGAARKGRNLGKGGRLSVEHLDTKEQEIAKFILEYHGQKVGDTTIESLDKFLLHETLSKLLAMTCNGWVKNISNNITNIVYVPNQKYCVSESMWNIKNGLLIDKRTGKCPAIDFDWVYNTKLLIKLPVVEDKSINVDTILENIRCQSRITN